MNSEITAEMIEDVFGKHSDSVRFANFCNAVVMAEDSASATTILILSEKPGADGGMDAEWTIPADVSFVGRNQELNRVAEWLKDATAKVIVLCGPSGMGKTRLALEATRPFAHTTTILDV